MANITIRKALKANGVFLWEVGKSLGVSEATMTRMMRTELPPKKKQEILEIIQHIRKERDYAEE